MSETTAPKTQRLIALDALRGFTIAAMVIVNDPGSWNHIYRPLGHAKWNGCTITDLIFPFFLGRVYGAKTITSFVMAGLLHVVFYRIKSGGSSLNTLWMEGTTGIGFDPKFASMLYALIYMLIIFIPALILYRKKIFIKI